MSNLEPIDQITIPIGCRLQLTTTSPTIVNDKFEPMSSRWKIEQQRKIMGAEQHVIQLA
jgi:hypothetical protein